MLMLTKSVLAMMISFITSTLLAILVIPLLKKMHAHQRLSIYLAEAHRNKKQTPTMGGLIFIIPTTIITIIFLFFNKMHLSYSLIIILFIFNGYALIGFIDDYLIIRHNNNKGLSEVQKLLLQLFLILQLFLLW